MGWGNFNNVYGICLGSSRLDNFLLNIETSQLHSWTALTTFKYNIRYNLHSEFRLKMLLSYLSALNEYLCNISISSSERPINFLLRPDSTPFERYQIGGQ